MAKDLTARLKAAPLLADGAMGTQLHAQGARFDQCFDALNLINPTQVAEVHRDYVEAGAELIETNTFAANRYKLAAYGLEAEVADINQSGVELAQRVIDASSRDVFLAGSVGPLGVRLVPFGRVKPQEAFVAFREQISALVEAGVDLIFLETFTDLYEVAEAVRAVHEVAPSMPLVASMTFTRDDRTFLGDDPARVSRELSKLGTDVVGVNCSGGPAQMLRVLQAMKQAVPEALFAVMPNAGWPERIGGRIMYPAGPKYFGEYAQAFLEAGARLVGGCCGSTPAHIAAMRSVFDAPPATQPVPAMVTAPADPAESVAAPVDPTQLSVNLARGDFVVSVEMDPPRGHNTHKLVAAASLLAEAGADMINVADAPLARMRMSAWAACHLIHREVGIETVLHFPIRGRNLLRVQGDLLAAHALDVRNLMVVMGDPTAIGDYPEAMDEYDLVPSGLIKLVKQRFNSGLDHARQSIGRPTSFVVGCALNLTALDMAREIKVLRRKIRNGADFAVTQPVYEVEAVREFFRNYEEQHGPLELPVIVGVLPLYSEQHAAFLHNEVPGINIPVAIRRRIERAAGAPAEGVRIANEMLAALSEMSGVSGACLMPPFSRYDLAAEIIESRPTAGTSADERDVENLEPNRHEIR